MPYPFPTSPAATAAMRANRRVDTKPEVRLRSALHRLGLRFRKDFPIATDERWLRVDLAFPRQRLVVFVDGCFWHGCPIHCRVPKANADYWIPKIKGNIERDRATDRDLARLGWRVLRIWEHEPLDGAVAQVMTNVARDPSSRRLRPRVARQRPHP